MLGLYFDGTQHYRPWGMYDVFDAQLILHGTDTYVSGVEYRLETPYDPGHAALVIMEIEHHDNYSIDLGDPWYGHSISFWPPLDGSADYTILCTYSFLTLQSCEDGFTSDWPIVVSPHPDSGFLRGTSYPGHELFDIIGETSYLCPSHWPPRLENVEVSSPRSVRTWFNQCVYNWTWAYDGLFELYTTSEPHDTIDVIHALKNPYDGVTGDDFFVYLESDMQEGVNYTLKASACCECNGCAISTWSFVYEGGFGELPDLVATFFVHTDFGIDLDEAAGHGCNEVELGYEIKNIGAAFISPFQSRITAVASGDTVTLWESSCDGLPVDGTIQGTLTTILPYLDASGGRLWLETDHTGSAEEVNEENNTRYYYLDVYRPRISTIEDVPDDYGKEVSLLFDASWYDIGSPAVGDIYRIMRMDRASGLWEEVYQLDASSDTLYSCIVPTVVDSSDAPGSYWSVFMVEYHRGSGGPWISCPDSGYSVNDLGPTAVLLVSSSIETAGESIVLKWSVTELPDTEDFTVSRSKSDGRFQRIGALPVIPGEYSFEFEDPSAEPGIEYIYRVEYAGGDGQHILFETEPAGLPRLPFTLHQNRPNPFNPSTEIGFSLPGPATVTLDIYDVSGKRVRRLLDENRPAGNHSIHWDGLDENGSQAVSGVYFYRLTAGKAAHSRKMVLLR